MTWIWLKGCPNNDLSNLWNQRNLDIQRRDYLKSMINKEYPKMQPQLVIVYETNSKIEGVSTIFIAFYLGVNVLS